MATNFFGGAFFGGGFFGGDSPTPDTDPIRNFSLREWRKWHRPEDEAELARRGLEPVAAEVIDDVAARQAADARLDDQQRLEELRGELALRGLELRSAHIEALNEHRSALIREELTRLFRQRQDERDIAAILLLAGSS